MQKKDIVSSVYFENRERFADLMNAYIFGGQQLITAEDIREISSTKARVMKEGKNILAQKVTADVAGEVSCGTRVALVLLENQTDIHYAMPVRVMNEESIRYHRQWREIAVQHKDKKDLLGAEYLSGFAKKDKLLPIVTIVLYLGKEPWDGPVCLHDMLELEQYPAELQQMIADYPIHLLEARRYTKLEDFKSDIKYVFGFLQREHNKESLRAYVEENQYVFSELSEDTYNVISVWAHSEELQELMESNKKGEKHDMCQAIKDMIEDGRQEGRREGRQEGRQEEQNRLMLLISKMTKAGESEQLSKLGDEPEFLQKMYIKYGV